MVNLIELKNVSKSFCDTKKETEVLKDITFSLKKGEKIAIVGPSGCGKSTILNLISGLITQDGGTVDINADVGYMFQTDNLFEWRSIFKNITLGLEIKGKVTDEDKKRILDLLEKYELIEFKDKHPSELSGGMRQRCALIRTLVLNPEILLLDEPFSALDAQTKLLVNEDIYKIVSEVNKSVIMVTHDIAEAISFSDKIVVLTKRPAYVKKIYNIEFKNLTDRTPLKTRNQKEFKEYLSLNYLSSIKHEEPLDENVMYNDEKKDHFNDYIEKFKDFLDQEEIDLIVYHLLYGFTFKDLAILKNVSISARNMRICSKKLQWDFTKPQ